MKAFYDEKPSVLEAVGNGNYLYRYGIREVVVEQHETLSEGQDEQQRTQWECEEVTIVGNPTSNKITEAVITERFSNNEEMKIINEYNGIALGVYKEKATVTAKKERYLAYLQERSALKAQVDTDCAMLGID